MIVEINSIEQAENVYNKIANNEILLSVAKNCTEFNNIDGNHIDIDQVQCVAQTLVDIADYGLMVGYNGFIRTEQLVEFFNEHQKAIAEQLEDDGSMDDDLTMYDIVAHTDKFKACCVIRAVENACGELEYRLEQ